MRSAKPYAPPFFLFNAHLETIYPSLLRRVSLEPYQRERINTLDDDFLDLDWLTKQSKKLVIISHGLEGSSDRPYIKGMARALHNNGFDVLAWNYRGCSGEMNKQLRFYHSGATDDLEIVIQHALESRDYQEIYLVGFSLGGNITLKYLGEKEHKHPIKKAITFSVPIDLKSSCEKISLPSNRIYAQRFIRSLKNKIVTKAALMSGLDTRSIDKIRTLQEFDDAYTAPLHGFENAVQYYSACSAIKFIENISIPTVIVNTQNDPFLTKECLPCDFKDHQFARFEILPRGGHVGFAQINRNGLYWSEQRAISWFTDNTL